MDGIAGVRVVAIYRDPRAASYSALRRNFDDDLRRLAVVHAEHLTLLAAQLRCIGADRYRLINYERMCLDPQLELPPVADFCGLSMDELNRFFEHEKFDPASNEKWIERTTEAERKFLNRYFDERRVRQWELVASELKPLAKRMTA